MGKAYRELTGNEGISATTPEMRTLCQRPGKRDKDGNIVYFTEQNHKNECDINKLIRKYDKTGLINHINKIEAKFGDMTGLDFRDMNDKIISARNMFDGLPSEIRNRFDNDVQKLLAFMDDPNNRDEGIKLGLIKKSYKEEEDGFGEHVVRDDDGNVIPKTEPDPVE